MSHRYGSAGNFGWGNYAALEERVLRGNSLLAWLPGIGVDNQVQRFMLESTGTQIILAGTNEDYAVYFWVINQDSANPVVVTISMGPNDYIVYNNQTLAAGASSGVLGVFAESPQDPSGYLDTYVGQMNPMSGASGVSFAPTGYLLNAGVTPNELQVTGIADVDDRAALMVVMEPVWDRFPTGRL